MKYYYAKIPHSAIKRHFRIKYGNILLAFVLTPVPPAHKLPAKETAMESVILNVATRMAH